MHIFIMIYVQTIIYLLLVLVSCVFGGWIDPDSSNLTSNKTSSLVDGSTFTLVYSDEFNFDGRSFDDGMDPRWTAVNKNDYTNYALHYYNAGKVKTSNGYLNITTEVSDVTFIVENDKGKKPYSKTKNYQSGMVQGWNKFCFTGGIVEISAKLPGKWDVGGLWPAMWLLGNLARATYVSSSDNVWPWSYNTCNRDIQKEQLISACNAINHYEMYPKQGRGAPEVDIMEAMPGYQKLINTPVDKPYYSASYQVSPGRRDYRPVTAQPPDPNSSWYDHDIDYGVNTSLNIFFYGMSLSSGRQEVDYVADAISANRNISEAHFDSFHKYRLEWKSGSQGYLKWYLDDEFVYSIEAAALSSTGAIIPEEPMYLILNTAISSTWGFPVPCPEDCPCDCFDCRNPECLCAIPWDMCRNLPANFLIDYVRVYQDTSDENQTIGCSTESHPTKTYIEGNPNKYMSAHDEAPLKPVAIGGAKCSTSEDCGRGVCFLHECKCESGYVGPNCLAANGFDDYVWSNDVPITPHTMFIPKSLFGLVTFLVIIFVLVTIMICWSRQRKLPTGYTEVPTSQRSVELSSRHVSDSSSSYQG